jgi:hypothetical protein
MMRGIAWSAADWHTTSLNSHMYSPGIICTAACAVGCPCVPKTCDAVMRSAVRVCNVPLFACWPFRLWAQVVVAWWRANKAYRDSRVAPGRPINVRLNLVGFRQVGHAVALTKDLSQALLGTRSHFFPYKLRTGEHSSSRPKPCF